jgi:hypothetical protein
MRVFRFLGPLGVALLIMTGCASLGSIEGGSAGDGSPTAPALHPAPDPSPAPPSPVPAPGNDMMPRMIVPATGGPPVLGIPLFP